MKSVNDSRDMIELLEHFHGGEGHDGSQRRERSHGGHGGSEHFGSDRCRFDRNGRKQRNWTGRTHRAHHLGASFRQRSVDVVRQRRFGRDNVHVPRGRSRVLGQLFRQLDDWMRIRPLVGRH